MRGKVGVEVANPTISLASQDSVMLRLGDPQRGSQTRLNAVLFLLLPLQGGAQLKDPSLFETAASGRRPLADRMRPRTLEEFVGQEHLLAPGKPLRRAIERGEVHSMVLWGPPGSGKTTLAYLIARYSDRHFEPFSAVTEGVQRVREIIEQAQQRLRYEGRGTILFCDEIHRFNKAQQDAFLPWVERGVITLIGATTENPSFELTPPLLSRLAVYVLEPLAPEHIRRILDRALKEGDPEAPPDAEPLLAEDALEALVRYADGDARRALNALEAVLFHARRRRVAEAAAKAERRAPPLSAADVEEILAKRLPRYDKAGEEHFNLISALHKAVRGSDVEGALYWLARMIAGGEDPLYIARRLVRIASEDIGLADPRALSVALAAKDAYHFLGSPEGELALAEAVIYLATAPKSNRVYEAWSEAVEAAREHPAEPVPLHIRNAPTPLLEKLGYGAGYRYDHAEPHALAAGQEYLPEGLRGAKWYRPSDRGYEKKVAERIAWWEELKRRASSAPGESG
ncbi:Replication-associated recombination protein A [bacterium HR33]|nr:Replication-associated recombination protein A [bacterium HR33]